MQKDPLRKFDIEGVSFLLIREKSLILTKNKRYGNISYCQTS